jgi:hypothetical protein
VKFIILLHFTLLFIKETSELFEALIAVLDIDVDTNGMWSEDYQGDLGIVAMISELIKFFDDQFIDAWTVEAIRWALGCCDLKTGYHSLVILRSLQSPIAPSFVQLLVSAVLYHLSRGTEEMCQDVDLFIGECFRIICEHQHNADVANFAFPFASAFLQCTAFQDR